MGYFITGATGLIGRHLLPLLAARGEPVFVLVRADSGARLERALAGCGVRRDLVVPIRGYLKLGCLGVSADDVERLRGRVQHFFHLAALYDLGAAAQDLQQANVEGTGHALELAHRLQAGCLHLVSSIAVAGRYRGRFTESMFAEAGDLDHPYFRSKHESEALVRSACRIPWRIYRPGMVVGHSMTGAMDKIDGPYYLFKPIQRVRDLLPQWVALPTFQGGHINLVPVDFVGAALDYLAHAPGQDGRCFHLTADDRRLGETVNAFARAAHAPTMRIPAASWEALSAAVPPLRGALAPVRRVLEQLLVDLQIPRSALSLLNYPTTFDATEARRLLDPAGIRPPKLEDYAWRLWDYWERELDPDAHPTQRLQRAVTGKRILVTGGSSGIGRATAVKLAAAGARVLIVGRDQGRLEAVRREIEASKGSVCTYTCDLTDPPACDRFLAQLLSEHTCVDILINNAGRSIRRGIDHAYDRPHDYERLMRINYHAAVRVTLALLPAMVRRGEGHIISLSSIGVLSNAPRFSAYNASKAALEAFSRCAAAEFKGRGVHFTIINMPLVRTPMVAPTRLYEQFKLLEPEEAAGIVCDAIVRRPERLTTHLGLLSLAVELISPALGRAIMSESFRLFPESSAPGQPSETEHPSAETPLAPEMHSLAALLHGVHY